MQVLDLSSNGLIYLPVAMFSSLSSLKELYLGNNSLDDVDVSSFTGLTSLLTLDLSHNNIRSDTGSSLHVIMAVQILYKQIQVPTSICVDHHENVH